MKATTVLFAAAVCLTCTGVTFAGKEILYVEKGQVVARVPVGFGPHVTKLSPDGRRLYVGTMFTDQVVVVDLRTFKPVKAISFDEAVRPFDISMDEKRMYVQLSKLHGFVVVDLERDTVIRKVDLPPLPEGARWPRDFPHTVNHGIALTPDNRYLFAAANIADYVAVYSVSDLRLLGTIHVGKEPKWLIFGKDGKFCYVSNRQSNDVSVISVAERKEITRIPVGQYPQRLVTVIVPDAKE